MNTPRTHAATPARISSQTTICGFAPAIARRIIAATFNAVNEAVVDAREDGVALTDLHEIAVVSERYLLTEALVALADCGNLVLYRGRLYYRYTTPPGAPRPRACEVIDQVREVMAEAEL